MMKRLMCIILLLGLLAGLSGCKQTEVKIEGNGFDTPEEAVLAFMEALKKGDVTGILSTFAVETFVDNCDMKVVFEGLKSYTPTSFLPLLNTDEYTRDINLIYRQKKITDNLINMYLTVVLDGWEDAASDYLRPVKDSEYADINELISDMESTDWMGLLAELNVDAANVYRPEEALAYKPEEKFDNINKGIADKIEESISRRRAYFGCDDSTVRVVDVTIDGVDYFLCMEVACYDGRWYNVNQGDIVTSIVMGSSRTGGLIERLPGWL